MHFICINLAFMVYPRIKVAVSFHYQSVIACSQDIFSHRVPTRMGPKGAFMDFLFDHVFVMSIHASGQDRVIFSFVEYITTQEELG